MPSTQSVSSIRQGSDMIPGTGGRTESCKDILSAKNYKNKFLALLDAEQTEHETILKNKYVNIPLSRLHSHFSFLMSIKFLSDSSLSGCLIYTNKFCFVVISAIDVMVNINYFSLHPRRRDLLSGRGKLVSPRVIQEMVI